MHGPCSRADLVRYSGLSAPTVSNTVAYLERKGLVEPLGPGDSNGGRPPDVIRFNSQCGYVAGIDIGTSLLRIALADLGGAVIDKWWADTHSRSTPERVTALIASAIPKLLRRHKIPSPKLLTLVVGVPGITNVQAGVVLSAPILASGWRAVPLRRNLESKTGIPVTVENDVNLAALGEKWHGAARGEKNFVFLTVGTGVGAGLFVNGRLYQGSDWTAGEIGYLYVPGTEETPVAIRRQGSLESIVGAKGIERAWRKFWMKGLKGIPHRSAHLAATEILDLAEQGESHAESILQHTARILADAITNVCVILNSSMVVFGGRVGSHPALFEATRKIVERNEFCRPKLALSTLGREAQLFGSICLALHEAEKSVLPPPTDGFRLPESEEISHLFQPLPAFAPFV